MTTLFTYAKKNTVTAVVAFFWQRRKRRSVIMAAVLLLKAETALVSLCLWLYVDTSRNVYTFMFKKTFRIECINTIEKKQK